MAPLTLESVRRLAGERNPPCLSLYMPTHRVHLGGQEDRIRFRNLLTRSKKLLEGSYSKALAGTLVQGLEELDHPDFWNHQRDGLALFTAPGLLQEFRLPMAVPELAIVADSFHLRPLMRFVQDNHGYLLLALSQKHVAFFAGNAEGLAPLEVTGLPTSLEAELGEEQREHFLGVRHPRAAGDAKAAFYGHGADKQPAEEDVLRYLRAIDRALWPLLRHEKRPLLLAAPIDYHAPFNGLSRYPHRSPEGLQGNFARTHPDELHRLAWPIVSQRARERVEEALETYASSAPYGRATAELERIGLHVLEGRVDELLVAEGAHVFGAMDPLTGEIRRHEGQQDGHHDDVLDDVAEAVVLRGGGVLAIDPARMPEGASAAAILRW